MSPSHHGKHERVFTNRGRAIQTTITTRNLFPEYQIFTLLDNVSKSDLYEIIGYSPLNIFTKTGYAGQTTTLLFQYHATSLQNIRISKNFQKGNV